MTGRQAAALRVLFDDDDLVAALPHPYCARQTTPAREILTLVDAGHTLPHPFVLLNPLKPDDAREPKPGGGLKAGKRDIAAARSCLVEFDAAGSPEDQWSRIKGLLPWSIATSSAGKSCHAVLSFATPWQSPAALEGWTKRTLYPWIKAQVGMVPDPACADITRLSRTPGGWRDSDSSRPQAVLHVGARVDLDGLPEPLRRLPRPAQPKAPRRHRGPWTVAALPADCKDWLRGHFVPGASHYEAIRRITWVAAHQGATGPQIERSLLGSPAYQLLGWHTLTAADRKLISSAVEQAAPALAHREQVDAFVADLEQVK